MGLESISEKLDKYYSRLEKGKAKKIKPTHVEKVISKLLVKQELLKEELGDTDKPTKTVRLEGKLVTVREQIERAEWLLEKIGS